MQLRWTLVPIECGYAKAPRVRVVDRRAEGEEGVVVVSLEASTEEQVDIVIRELNKLLPEPFELLPKA